MPIYWAAKGYKLSTADKVHSVGKSGINGFVIWHDLCFKLRVRLSGNFT